MRYQGVEAGGVIQFSEVVSAMSHALDITEGQPAGHAARSCMIGMAIGEAIGLSAEQSSALFYALLLKDLGCSTNASKVCYLFGADDRAVKHDLKTTDWRRFGEQVRYVARNVQPGASLLTKAARVAALAAGGQRVAREMVEMRCTRGADIARGLQLPEASAEAIAALDEHWDGGGHPLGLKGDQIPLLARVMCLAQTAEVFWQAGGLDAAFEVAEARSGTWFDPELASAFVALRHDAALAASLAAADPAAEAARLEPPEGAVAATEGAMDRVAEAFARVIDAKSPWTFCHSSGVAEVAVGTANVLGMGGDRLRDLRRAALLHDVGKLGVSNLILDKPGKLTPEELTAMRRHPEHTLAILGRVKCFARFAEAAASHHERLDGRGYHKGIGGADLNLEVRILAVADVFEALSAKRPYRKDLTQEDVFTVLDREAGVGLCPAVVAALKTFVVQSRFVPYQIAA